MAKKTNRRDAEAQSKQLNGVQLIAAERTRQIEDEKWSVEHDNSHVNFELAEAGACYAAAAVALNKYYRDFKASALKPPMFDHLSWPWATQYWKPSEDPIRNLEKAGALIAAEIDRLLRKGARS